MRPELFTLFGVGFPAYFVLLVTGFMFATAAGVIWARRIGQNPDVIVDLGIAMLLAGVFGGRILHVLADGHLMDYVHLCTDPSRVDWPLDRRTCVSAAYGGVWDAAAARCHPSSSDCLAWAKFWAGGLTYYGGLIGAGGVAVFLLKRDGFPFWKAADMAGFAVPIGLAFGRLGCLLAGCCFGSVCHLPWALSFPAGGAAAQAQAKAGQLASERLVSLPVHPTQVYESLGSLALAAFCVYVVMPRKRYDGEVFAVFIAGYAVLRFALEFLRRDERGGLLGLSTSQLIGLALVAFAVAIHLIRRPKVSLRDRAEAYYPP